MKRIALVIPGLDRIGGAEKQLMLLARGLKRRGWRVSVVCLSGLASAVGELDGIELVLLGMRHGLKDPGGWLRFVNWVRRERPEIVHAHLPHASWLARWARLMAPVRVLVDTIHTSATGTWGRRIGYRLSRWIPDGVTVVSKSAAKNWLEAGMVNEKMLTIFPNGVEIGERVATREERIAARAKLGLGEGFEWMAAGRLEAVKDYPMMLRAFAQLPESARLSIAGVGAEEGALRKLARELGAEGRVRWLGFVADLRLWLTAADGFVLSSLWEGLPIGVLEAAAHGLPVVATDASGVRESLPDEDDDWLIPVGDAYALGEKMRLMMGLADEERDTLGKRNFDFSLNHFDIERILDRWEEFYGKLLATSPGARRWGK